MNAFRRWFLGHWFGGVFAIIAGIWIVTLIAYAAGAEGISFRNRYTGQPATIDFMRKHDHPMVGLAEGVGLELHAAGEELHGTVVKIEPAWPVVGWVCGEQGKAGGLARVDYRQGDWVYRAPRDESNNHEAVHGRREESRNYILTLAYDRATGERVIVPADASLDAQAKLLEARGLVVADASRITLESLVDLPVVSVQREGCIIFNAAFVAVSLLWLVLGGLAALIVRVVRARRAR